MSDSIRALIEKVKAEDQDLGELLERADRVMGAGIRNRIRSICRELENLEAGKPSILEGPPKTLAKLRGKAMLQKEAGRAIRSSGRKIRPRGQLFIDVIRAMKDKAMSPAEVAKEVETTAENAGNALRRMLAKGLVECVEKGLYRAKAQKA